MKTTLPGPVILRKSGLSPARRLKDKAQKTREDGVFTLKLDEGVSLAMLVSFAQDMIPGVSTEDIGVWPADDGELGVSVRGGGAVASN